MARLTIRKAALLGAFLALMAAPPLAQAAAGDLDGGFGSGGVTSLGAGTQLYAVALQSDGTIVATGSAGPSLLVERFSAGGAPQSAFAAGTGVGRGIAVQSDGKIVVAGTDAAGMLVERFNSNGTLDGSFGSGGVVHAFAGASANAMALGPGGTIVVAGQVLAGDSFQRVAVLRLNSNGSPDGTIGPGGAHLVDLGQDSIARSVAVQGDSKIILAGSLGPGTHQSMAGFVTRLSSNGNVDLSFGTGGGLVVSIPQNGGAVSTLNAVTLDPAGGIVAAGGSTTANQSEAVFLRLTCSGGADTSFAGSGVQVVASSRAFVTDPLGANAVAIAGGRRIVGAGEYRDSGLSVGALWSFEPNGAGDFASTAIQGARAQALVVDPAGNFVVAGNNIPAGVAPSGFVARYQGFGAPASGNTPCGGSAGPPPAGSRPTVSTGASSAIGTNKATISGAVNPNGQATTYHFDYGTSSAYGSQSAAASAGSGTSSAAVSANLTGLVSGKTYHYRLVATNASGAAFGSDATFTTSNSSNGSVPSLSRVGQSSSKWTEKKSKHSKLPVGTVFSFTLSASARVTIAITHSTSGRKVRGKCVAQTKNNRRNRSCRRSVTDGTLSISGRSGKNSVSFKGTLSRRKTLKLGTYTATLVAIGPTGRKSKATSLTFTIVG